MRLLLTRHGQTPSNIKQVLDTLPPGPGLTDEGHLQAAQLADAMTEHPITAVYASTATRAQQTAQPLAEKLGLPVTVLDGIHEVYVGDVEGRNDRAALELFADTSRRWVSGELDARCAGGESGHEVLTRASRVFELLAQQHAEQTVLVVSHGGLIRLVASTIADNVAREFGAQSLANTAQVVLDHHDRHWRCHTWSGIEL